MLGKSTNRFLAEMESLVDLRVTEEEVALLLAREAVDIPGCLSFGCPRGGPTLVIASYGVEVGFLVGDVSLQGSCTLELGFFWRLRVLSRPTSLRATERARVVGPVGDDTGGGVWLGGLSFMEAEGAGRRRGARGDVGTRAAERVRVAGPVGDNIGGGV
jgi:hypothetical protein